MNALAAVPKISERYFFWTGESKMGSATGAWQRTLKAVFDLAGVPDGHAHRFRDTFAVGVLQVNVPIERVSVLLGHSSITVTEKYYSPWVRARQEQLEADVRRSWAPPEHLTKPGVVGYFPRRSCRLRVYSSPTAGIFRRHSGMP